MAKFKVGDKVKVVGRGLASRGWVGKVAKIRTGGWPYVVKFDGRDDGEYAEEEIALANAVRNAKFKAGDKVMVKDPKWGNLKGIVTAVIDDPVLKKAYTIRFDNGAEFSVIGDIVHAANASCNSANPVVAKAVNACAKNATMGEIKAQLNPAKVKEAYQLLNKAAESLERCIPALKASNIAKAWPRTAEMYGEARSKLNNLMMQFEGELQDMIR